MAAEARRDGTPEGIGKKVHPPEREGEGIKEDQMQHGVLENVYFLSFVAWPLILIGCALFSMMTQGSFSWSELVLDYLAGMLIGVFFYMGTEKKPQEVFQFFLIFSQGLPGVLHAAGVKSLQSRETLFLVSSVWMGGSVLLSALLDLATRKIGLYMNVGGGLLSILIAGLKLPFSLCTTAVGYLFLLAGLVWLAISKAREDASNPDTQCRVSIGFLGGVPFVEWNNDDSDGSYRATTVGAMINVWKGKISSVLKHELYHTRQYMYFHDWMIPFWLVGGLWGMISAAIANAGAPEDTTDVMRSFHTARADKEVGNPMERAAYAGGNAA
jgi:hypothetical protein